MQDNNEIEGGKQYTVRKSFLGAGLACLLATSAFFSGVHVGRGSLTDAHMQAGLFSFWDDPKPEQKSDVDLTEFWKVWNLMDEKFVSSSSTAKMSLDKKIQGAIKGMVASYGDPYTIFMPPAQAGMFGEDIAGNFGGVGMEVGMRDGVVAVIAPLPDTPAAKAGIVAKDVLVKIGDKSTEGMSIDEAVRLIRGEKGTKVHLTIFRDGEKNLLEFDVVRADITVPTVATKQIGGIFVISLYSFNAISEAKVNEALDTYSKSGAQKLVLDLRGNPGGYLQSAVAIASRFLPAGMTVVSEKFGDGTDGTVYRSSGNTLGDHMPKEMVVLVDGGSASASEILAGALKENNAATLIGAQTFGKGSVQELIPLDDGSSLKVTVAHWYTPKGISISLAGLAPNIFVDRTPQEMLEGKDPQLDAAVAFLNGNKNVGTTTPPKAR